MKLCLASSAAVDFRKFSLPLAGNSIGLNQHAEDKMVHLLFV